MWKIVFEDGDVVSSVGESAKYWTDLPKDKKINKVLFFSHELNTGRELSGMDCYFYVIEAVALVGNRQVKESIEAEILGGINLKEETISELKLNYRTGVLEEVMYPLSQFKYSKDILIPKP